MTDKNKPLIIANMSGFYGDRMSGPREMIEGGKIDFLTGDYLAELTMAILYKAQLKRPDAGYAVTFLKQMEDVMGVCLEKGVRVVSNAGGMNPAGLAKALEGLATRLGLNPKIAYVEGDNLITRLDELRDKGAVFTHLDKGTTLKESKMMPVSANAYMGCWGIVEALDQGADIVVTGRVADASVVMGPAAHHFGWAKNDWNQLAGAAVAGHIIECSGQASGGNYSYFEEVATFNNLGFPIAEVYHDGSTVITKHDDTGGQVSIGTVTSQLLYEVNAPAYITPDVVAHIDTANLKEIAKNRVKVSGVLGSPATSSAKVTLNCVSGFKNEMTFGMVGLNHEKKAEVLKAAVIKQLGGEKSFDEMEFTFYPTHKDNPNSWREAISYLQVSVIDGDAKKAGKFFSSKLIEMALSTVPGMLMTAIPGPAKPRIVHFPALVDKKFVTQRIVVNGKVIDLPEEIGSGEILHRKETVASSSINSEEMVQAYLGDLFATRSGDKGGNANLAIWGRDENSFQFLRSFLTIERLKNIMQDVAPFEIRRYEFPNLFGLNFLVVGLLGEGVAANALFDPQAKSLGEYLRAKKVEVPIRLMYR